MSNKLVKDSYIYIYNVSWTDCDSRAPSPDGDEADANVDGSDGAAEQPQLPEDTRNVMWNVLAELGIPQGEKIDEDEEED